LTFARCDIHSEHFFGVSRRRNQNFFGVSDHLVVVENPPGFSGRSTPVWEAARPSGPQE
jgi:hypothetical protein